MGDVPSVIGKLRSVRDVRLHLAELALARTERELAAGVSAEEEARRSLAGATERRAIETAQADETLLHNKASGRVGIANWLAARKRAESALQAARVKLADASSSRIGLEHECSTARGHWRAVRVDVERLRLLAESMKGDTHES